MSALLPSPSCAAAWHAAMVASGQLERRGRLVRTLMLNEAEASYAPDVSHVVAACPNVVDAGCPGWDSPTDWPFRELQRPQHLRGLRLSWADGLTLRSLPQCALDYLVVDLLSDFEIGSTSVPHMVASHLTSLEMPFPSTASPRR